MDKIEIVNQLTEIFRNVFSDDTIELREDMTTEDVENWDSLTNMMMIEEIQQVFGFRFKLKQLPTLNTVGNIIEAIRQNLEQ